MCAFMGATPMITDLAAYSETQFEKLSGYRYWADLYLF